MERGLRWVLECVVSVLEGWWNIKPRNKSKWCQQCREPGQRPSLYAEVMEVLPMGRCGPVSLRSGGYLVLSKQDLG